MRLMATKPTTTSTRAKAAKKSATKVIYAKKIKLPSGRIVSVDRAVKVAKRAGILTQTGKLARFYATK